MSIDSGLPITSAAAAYSLPGAGISAERAAHAATAQAHLAASDRAAAGAEGVGSSSAEESAVDAHHGDGRRPWELPARETSASATENSPAGAAPPSPGDDALGRGLDLTA